MATTTAATRRLAAILAADVAGYSRLMGVDEEGTLERLKALRLQLVDPKIAEHRGRIVKTTGAAYWWSLRASSLSIPFAREMPGLVVYSNGQRARDRKFA